MGFPGSIFKHFIGANSNLNDTEPDKSLSSSSSTSTSSSCLEDRAIAPLIVIGTILTSIIIKQFSSRKQKLTAITSTPTSSDTATIEISLPRTFSSSVVSSSSETTLNSESHGLNKPISFTGNYDLKRTSTSGYCSNSANGMDDDDDDLFRKLEQQSKIKVDGDMSLDVTGYAFSRSFFSGINEQPW